jgi:hypothetical protein
MGGIYHALDVKCNCDICGADYVPRAFSRCILFIAADSKLIFCYMQAVIY